MPRSSTAVRDIVHVRLPPELQGAVQTYMDRSGDSSVSDALRTLLVRGLYLEARPSGRFTEPAFTAAYLNERARLQGRGTAVMMSAEVQGALSRAMLQGEEERTDWLHGG